MPTSVRWYRDGETLPLGGVETGFVVAPQGGQDAEKSNSAFYFLLESVPKGEDGWGEHMIAGRIPANKKLIGIGDGD